MKKIYRLLSDVNNYCSFIENYPKGTVSIISRSMSNRWRAFDESYSPIVLELQRNQFGRKNYEFDVSGALAPFYVFSEKTLHELGDILESRGQILSVITASKKKKFFGYYPLNSFSGCLDKEKSVYREYENGLVVEKPVLIGKNIPEDDLFTIEEDRRVFVTSQFKIRAEESGLVGFDFSIEVPVY